MAQLKSTTINGNLVVTGDITLAGGGSFGNLVNPIIWNTSSGFINGVTEGYIIYSKMGKLVNMNGYFIYPSSSLPYGTLIFTLPYKPIFQTQGIAQTDGNPSSIFLDLKTNGSFCPQPINSGNIACRFNLVYFTND